ncbi:MAG: amidohydrolase family protein [Candidatus Methanospirareceae archaeon]
MREVILSGIVVYGEDFEEISGYVVVKDGEIREIGRDRDVEATFRGIIAPSFINLHTHIGDSVVKEVDFTSLEGLVGPGGFKERILRETPYEKLVNSMKDTIKDIIATGTQAFVDFREGGVLGVRMLKDALCDAKGKIKTWILGRPAGEDEDIDMLLREVEGIGMSSTADHPYEYLMFLAEEAKKRGKLFAIHAGERNRNDIEDAIELEPDFMVHLTKATLQDLEKMSEEGIGAVVCVRSNLVTMAGLPPLKEMLAVGLTVGIGTDNVMLNSPNMFSEMEFVSKIFHIDEREVLKMCTLNGAKILKDEGSGVIEEGKRANILVIRGDTANMRGVRKPIRGVVRRATRNDIAAVIHEGRIVAMG